MVDTGTQVIRVHGFIIDLIFQQVHISCYYIDSVF